MKKSVLLFSTFAFIAFSSVAQNKDSKKSIDAKPVEKAVMAAPQTTATPDAANMNPDLSMKFNEEDHNFGSVPEGPSVSYDFELKNIGKVPIIISNAHGSCGCTVPTWPKEPILPGKTSKITVTYSTQGRPGQINKTVTVTTNVGTKVLKISGNVDKAAAPANNTNTPAEIKH